jgi:hypothetical protein
MAPRKAANPGKSARYYAAHPKAAAKKNAAQKKRNATPKNKEYRASLNAERRRRGVYGKAGADMSHTKSGKLVAESPKKNRARNGANGKSTRK